MNGVKDYPKTGDEKETMLKALSQSMLRMDSHLANLIGQGDLQIDMVTQLGKYTGERNRPILVTFAMLWDWNLILKNKANLPKGVETFHLKYKKEETY